jgi:serine/threonine protein phosphatase PrpC
VAFFLRKRELTVSNVGDSRALIVSHDQVTQLSEDHRLENPKERKRVLQAGARIDYPYVMRGMKGLMPTRSLGDSQFEDVGIISVPFTADYLVEERDIYLLVGCDGLFDVMRNEEVADMARRYPKPEQLVCRLKQETLQVRRGTDNLTLMAVSFDADGP